MDGGGEDVGEVGGYGGGAVIEGEAFGIDARGEEEGPRERVGGLVNGFS